MNLDLKSTIKHRGMLNESAQVNVKKIEDDTTEDGVVSEKDLGSKESMSEDNERVDSGKGVFGPQSKNNVSFMFLELVSTILNKNASDEDCSENNFPEMPPPIELNPLLSSTLNRKACMDCNLGDDNSSKGMKGYVNKVGESSGLNDVNILDNNNFKKPMSFSNVVQGSNYNGDNKLKVIPCTINEGRIVVDMDHIIDEGGKKWGLIIGCLYFFKFKSDDGLQSVIENGPWLVDQKPLFVQRWVVVICLEKPEPARIPLWLKIYN
ncbi:zinc knuckle CX2CX4HX4C containing protein [Tanacetum coccineum]